MRFWLFLLAAIVLAGPAAAQNTTWPAKSIKFSDTETLQAKWDAGEVTSISSADCSAITTGTLGTLCQETGDDSLWRCTTTTCNAAGWESVGGSGSQTPWTGIIDAAGFDLFDIGTYIAWQEKAADEDYRFEFPTWYEGSEWKFGGRAGTQYDFGGGLPDNIFNIAINRDDTFSVNETTFMPGATLQLEGFYFANWAEANKTILAEVIFDVARTYGTATVNADPGFIDDKWVRISEPAGGLVVAHGVITDTTGTTVTVTWTGGEATITNPPANGDTIASTATTTVTGRTGAFTTDRAVELYATGTCSGTIDGYLGVVVSSGDDLTLLQYSGRTDDFVSGRCIKQVSTGYTATLGTVTTALSATLTSGFSNSYFAADRTLFAKTEIISGLKQWNFTSGHESRPFANFGSSNVFGASAPFIQWGTDGYSDVTSLTTGTPLWTIGSPGYEYDTIQFGCALWYPETFVSNSGKSRVCAPAGLAAQSDIEWPAFDARLTGFDSASLPADNVVPKTDGTGGKLQSSGVTIDDDDNIVGATNLSCNASWQNEGSTDLDDATSLSTTLATIEVVTADLTESDPDDCWTFPTANNMELLYTQGEETANRFVVTVSGTAKMTTGGVQRSHIQYRSGATCVDGTGSTTITDKQMVLNASFHDALPAHRSVVTLDSGDRLCINYTVSLGTDTITVRDLHVQIERVP